MQVHAPAARPPLDSGGPQKQRHFPAVRGLPLTAVKSRDKKLPKGLFIIDNGFLSGNEKLWSVSKYNAENFKK